ncbi:MAG: hypothetical protein MUF54_10865 [Polyangiaceae bacterium]|jgi:hypothetical protein|nr:hypothetical protein [Polyangiaceae bacterium]
MTNPFHGGTPLQRALLAVGAMLGASALFVGVVVVLISSVVDLAVGSASKPSSLQSNSPESTEQARSSAPAEKPPKPESHKRTGERS